MAWRLKIAILFVLMVVAVRPATAREWLYLRGAGSPEINGIWERVEDCNNAPQYERKITEERRFELFLHLEPLKHGVRDAWWNIQEKIVQPGSASYGPVYYGAYLGEDLFSNSYPLPLDGWVCEKQGWEGEKPGPHIQILGDCSSVLDCEEYEDDCFNYYVDIFTWNDFINTPPPQERWCTWENWMREIEDWEIEKARRDFFEIGIVSFPNFLKPEVMDELRAGLEAPKQSGFWQASFWDHVRDRALTIPHTRENQAIIKRNLAIQHALRTKNRYAYSFTRTSQDYDAKYRNFYKRYFEDTVHFLQSLELQNLLTRITDRYYELSVYFISRYTSGDFLDRHSDSVETRQIAFTLQYSKDWKLEFGGLLLFLNQSDWNIAERVSLPTYNTLTFFDVSEERRLLPHLVTEVVANLDKKRMAITGWMQYVGQQDPFSFSDGNGY